ncbi:MAG TPA: alpha-L-fucosidase [bacterium]|nr:alpha-L-fucosidase [bacterium]
MKIWFPKRAIHLDFHTMPGVYDVGRDFDPDEFAKTLKEANVDYITVFARCNLGFAYYPTEIGIVHPGLKRKDLLGEMVSACHKKGIKVAAYFNAVLDHQHAILHREWCKVNRNGQVAEVDKMGHFFRKMCLNTGYKEHLLGMVEEVLDMYPVDGIFLDCFSLLPCYGVECIEGMRKLGMDPDNEKQGWEFCWIITKRFGEEVKKLLKVKKRDIFLYFNGLPYRYQPTHIELEVLPTGGWGYDYLPWIIRYARTLKKPYFTMTGRFHKSWGDFGGLRPEHSLLFDLYNSIANGGTCSVGDHMHPRGKLEKPVYEMIGRCYSKIKEIEEFTEGAKSEADVVIIDPTLERIPGFPFDYESIAGATRMLMELKYQFDVSDGLEDISKYSVVVLPDSVSVDGKLKEKLEKHLEKGGIIISSGYSGIDREKGKFVVKGYKIEFEGDEENDPSFFVVEKEVSEGIPDMPITIYQKGISIKAEKGAKVLARHIKPYFNIRSWDWEHENLYTPPEKETGRTVLIQCGNIFHFSFPIFKGYFNDAVVWYKNLLKNCIEMVYREPLIKYKNLPSFAQVTLTSQKGRRMVHILSYLPELRGKEMQIIEEPILLKDVSIGVRQEEGEKTKKVYCVPSYKQLEFRVEKNYIWFIIPEMCGYQMVVIE